MTLRTLNYGNYGIFLIMGNAGFCPSTVGIQQFGTKAWAVCGLRKAEGLKFEGSGLGFKAWAMQCRPRTWTT